MWASELQGQRQRRTCASVQSAAGALAEREGGRGSLRGKRRSGGSWNSSNCYYHVAAHARESALLPARLSKGAGASGSKVLEGQSYFQEPSGAALSFLFLRITSVWGLRSFSWTERGILCHYCVSSLKAAMGLGKNNSGQAVKADVQKGGGFLSLFLCSRA